MKLEAAQKRAVEVEAAQRRAEAKRQAEAEARRIAAAKEQAELVEAFTDADFKRSLADIPSSAPPPPPPPEPEPEPAPQQDVRTDDDDRGGDANLTAAAMCMCRAFTQAGKPCRNRVHKHAGCHGHREHTCGVHKAFKGELQHADHEQPIDVTDHADGGRSDPPPPPPPTQLQEQQAAQAKQREAEAKQRAAEERARKRSLELKQQIREVEAEKQRAAEECAAARQRAAQAEAAAGAMAPPDTWTPMANDTALVPLAPGSEEWRSVVSAFVASAEHGQRSWPHASVAVTAVDRVQNMPHWRSYSFNRRLLMERENVPEAGMRRFERLQLWHGTSRETASKITTMGFNRSFCGKNATRFGKGVYFARHAGYSLDPKYSEPDACGLQRILCCRVLVGEYAVGACGMIEPPARHNRPGLLCDSTVDQLANPSIFVAFKDDYAFPEYVVTFRCL
jgi:hypothetical protein